MLKEHWAVLGLLRGAGVTLSSVIWSYHARGVVPSGGDRFVFAR
jgi:hypothetical protein